MRYKGRPKSANIEDKSTSPKIDNTDRHRVYEPSGNQYIYDRREDKDAHYKTDDADNSRIIWINGGYNTAVDPRVLKGGDPKITKKVESPPLPRPRPNIKYVDKVVPLPRNKRPKK